MDIASNEDRIILSRDKALLSSQKVRYGYYVRATDKHEQLKEVVNKFDLYAQFKSFTRCMTCNTCLEHVSKEDVVNKIDAEIACVYKEFFYCKQCDKVFWKGSHFNRMEVFIKELVLKHSQRNT